ncbi:probable arabinosyltransferase ARAD1 [Solanum stenotomum]|uniref:probable arabinosyltransferase ARAD1 n=1 Tax=Solanum stenotomum TaxID=172797 RepID=UPI0020D19D14|nr:probable arabinosyltransferase ARAD1 [Solanum stenotomum]
MSLFIEKSMLASRFLSCLMAISISVLIVSSLSLVQFADNSFIPSSVYRLILANPNSSLYSTSCVESKTPFLPLETSFEKNAKSHNTTSYQASSSISNSSGCDTKQALLRVYMYDLPPEFHFGLLGWKGNGKEMWPNVDMQGQVPSYPGGLNLQHSIEYWLTLDLLSSNITRPCTAIRVQNSSEADVIFVPFFSSLSYNRHSRPPGKGKVSLNRILQDRVVEFLRSRHEWKISGGVDHVIVAHHPNSMLVARKKLSSAMFVLADFGRYRKKIANIEKDVIAPYKHIVKTLDANNSPSFGQRHILVYFQGEIYRKNGGTIRQELYHLLKDEKDVHFSFGSIKSNGVREAGRGMMSSKFCLYIAGDTPSSNRLFDAISSHCIPVIISDDIELPFEDILDYSKFCIFIPSSYAVRKGYLLNFLRGIKEDQWIKMWKRLKEFTKHFEYQYPSQPNDSVDMIWQVIARKLSYIQLKAHRHNRYRTS